MSIIVKYRVDEFVEFQRTKAEKNYDKYPFIHETTVLTGFERMEPEI